MAQKILIVEDNEITSKLTRLILEREGFEVFVAPTAYRQGADDYLIKPASARQIIERVRANSFFSREKSTSA